MANKPDCILVGLDRFHIRDRVEKENCHTNFYPIAFCWVSSNTPTGKLLAEEDCFG
jgi:hypothetical protein